CRASPVTGSSPASPGRTHWSRPRKGAAPRSHGGRSSALPPPRGKSMPARAACAWRRARPTRAPALARTQASPSISVRPARRRRAEQASVHIDVTVGDPGSGGRLRQLTTSLSSRGLALGYQRDLFDGGVRGHTYRLGFAGGERRLAAGVAAALYRGGTSGTGWDVGAVYDLTPSLTIGATVANVGRPVVRDSTLPVTYTPGATFRLSGARAAF